MTLVEEENGVRCASVWVGGLRVSELRFPPSYDQAPVTPDGPYVAVVLDGGLVKSFPTRTVELGAGSVVTMPGGERHAARFRSDGARILVVAPAVRRSAACGDVLGSLRHVRDAGLAGIARRLATEVWARDDAAPLAVEGLGLELVATVSRRSAAVRRRRRPGWLDAAEDLLEESGCRQMRLSEVAAAVGVHPAHLARVFREHHGVSVGEYVRRLRLDRAAARLRTTDVGLAALAAEAGFADQSHFTRAFRGRTGLTPGRYREAVRVVPPFE
jgi:AraC family transcriptional regulator